MRIEEAQEGTILYTLVRLFIRLLPRDKESEQVGSPPDFLLSAHMGSPILSDGGDVTSIRLVENLRSLSPLSLFILNGFFPFSSRMLQCLFVFCFASLIRSLGRSSGFGIWDKVFHTKVGRRQRGRREKITF